MRFSTIAVAASAGVASAQSTNTSICDKYTTALLMDNTASNQFALVALLVKTAVIGNFTGPGTANPSLPGSKYNFSGLLAPGNVNGTAVNLAPYFSGALASTNVNGKPAVVNFLDGQSNITQLYTDPMFIGNKGTNQYTLFAHLVSYFGVLLGCSQYGQGSFPAYGGSNSQYNVHKYMDISEAEFSWFNMNVAYSAQSFGASTDDIMAVGSALNMAFGYRCAAPAAVVPAGGSEQQVICVGEGCPLAASPVAGCSGAAAVAGATPSEPASATASATMMMTGSATGSAATMSMTGSATGAAGSASMAAGSAASGAAGAASSAAGSAAGNAAPRQTAAAGLLAGAAAVAAAML